MRIAWIGPPPTDVGTVTHISAQLIEGLVGAGVAVDCYAVSHPDVIPHRLHDIGVQFAFEPMAWEWGRWYSRAPLSQFASGSLARAAAQSRLVKRLATAHARQPYDLLYQSSQIELFGVRRLRRSLPPLVLHPHTHAAGELRGLREERTLADQCAPAYRNRAVRGMMAVRASLQRRDIQLAHRVVALSHRFADLLARDYSYPRERLLVSPNPIDLRRFRPDQAPTANGRKPHRVLFVSRISVRKGVETIVALSHELADLEGQLHIEILGDHSMWSDYRPLLRKLNGGIASYIGPVTEEVVAHRYRDATALIQPSRFEPFGLTVAEALASGTPVIASDEVGAAEGIDSRVCRVVPSGDVMGYATAIREILATFDSGGGPPLRALARREAEQRFAPASVAKALAGQLESSLADS